ncbi:MAG: riboflavin synthase [Gemmatimonadota bacterium]|nr:riboflavin synthase [Gemmatimonadota bacterium]
MFTGLIEHVGKVEQVAETPAGRELRISAPFTDLRNGDSIAVNGACLTVRNSGEGWFEAAAVLTTLERTAIGDWSKGARVNLERAMRADARLGGHIVLGHVDCVAAVTARETRGDALLIDLELPTVLEPLFALRGSVAVDGVSLTVNDLRPGGLQVALVEYTLRNTTLGDLRVGSRVHIEADVIAKHVRRLLEPYLRESPVPGSAVDFSLEH